MQQIENLIKTLPIQYDNKELNLLKIKDINWYCDNCRKAYYNKYMDFNFSTDITEKKLRESLYILVKQYIFKVKTNNEVRLILKDKCSNTIYGGCTIHERIVDSKNYLELAYFIVEEYQNNGLASEMIKQLTDKLSRSSIKFNGFIAMIRSDNIASEKLLLSNGFHLLKEKQGKYKINKEYIKERE
jgi:predicted acetyltransferase